MRPPPNRIETNRNQSKPIEQERDAIVWKLINIAYVTAINT